MLRASSFRCEEDFTGCKIVSDDHHFSALHVTLVDKVAKGGWGQVYLGQVTNGDGGFVAVKVITSGNAISPPRINQVLKTLFEVEVGCLSDLTQHESAGVLKLYGSGVIQGRGVPRHFLILEWMACGDVQQLMERCGQALDVEAAGSVLLHVLRALRSAHDLGYMHRDVKASNILLGFQGEVALADWGICGRFTSVDGCAVCGSSSLSHDCVVEVPGGEINSTIIEKPCSPKIGDQGNYAVLCKSSGLRNEMSLQGPTDTSSQMSEEQTVNPSRSAAEQGAVFVPGAPMGTPFWAAPELDKGLPHDQSVDIWSFGITFIELITGIQPYYDTSPEGLSELADPRSGFVPVGLPEEIMSWLPKCLSVDPKERPCAHELLQQPFFLRLAAVQYLQLQQQLQDHAAAVEAYDAGVDEKIMLHAEQAAENASGVHSGLQDNLSRLVEQAPASAMQQTPPLFTYQHSHVGMFSDRHLPSLNHSSTDFSRAKKERHPDDRGNSGSSSENDWDPLPLKPLLLPGTQRDDTHLMSQGISDAYTYTSPSQCKENGENGRQTEAEDETGSRAEYNSHYPHLDPDVVEEMLRLHMIRRQNSQ
ncbi:hypothetical protein CEUSTIGMA_g1566.t1 [Chlamydomonas eustigma]|uniref:Protein kinase domain-containing protein n=1 Tax=Chlamydomonas eustigma TaxID=1157962 RepID=A0A250WTG3_9CHLO|nr:hypothetical protein CEUSTIGMA_g1566.t1 [Chlamydomonas eustigma]|eukprot:GAX74117.1 hypothetical protein CEUSTIGMA_g1566.t1 [Chlamydomonas eustigma]